MHSFDRSQLETGPCPAAPGGEFIITMTPPRDVLREQLRVILYYRLGDKLWVVSHDDVVLSKFMQATCEQEVLGADLKGPEKLGRFEMLTTAWPGRWIIIVLAAAVLAAAVMAARQVMTDDEAMRGMVAAMIIAWACAAVSRMVTVKP